MSSGNKRDDFYDNQQQTGHTKRPRDPAGSEPDERRRRIAAESDSKPMAKSTAHKVVSNEESVENRLKLSTIGLVNLEEFQRIKGELEEERQREAAKTIVHRSTGDTLEGSPKGARQKTKSKSKRPILTFEDDEDELIEHKTRKNPAVDTSFLPDKEREEQDAQLREKLRKAWLQEQESIKQEPITITYSYWDGSGHRKQVRCKKGDTIAQFLDKCKAQVPELRTSSVDGLVYIKEDLIIPHHYSFYDFILNKARGKSGPLFSFDVHDDVRLTHDARVEKDDSHAGKVCERSWYERNKHIFPANRWEVFNPEKIYGSYTIRDSKKPKS
ncbi:hypothetical protein H4R26_003318 [Coemansia thaxteri]|uniref:FAM50A/XAP5 C-terminal domain-containing protein n=1 Tax=Coemansia thaxteri TaxID=2663907 RepID=A0A9W8EF47_9FUNG|nr:hypothetical protein H4R26_003318 [Coemansia thaxteri]